MSKIFSITEGLENLGALRTGGQGSVYKGRRMGPVICAVKVLPTPIHSENAEDKNFRNFQSEVEKLKKVNESPNPNIVKILNSGLTESGSLPFIEMEFIEGPDLEELLKPPYDPVFPIKEVIKVADHLSNALAHCHNLGVKHGDVKSNNVKYNIHTGNYVLLDFGLAIMSDEQRRTSVRHAGAIEFMAPEQNTGIMLFETDIYSYGIILYELLAGQVPFPLRDDGETSRNGVMIAHMETPVPDLWAVRKKNLPEGWSAEKQEQEMRLPQWLLQLITVCLEKDPEKRYPNGQALQEALFINSIDADRSGHVIESLELLRVQNAELAEQLSSYKKGEVQERQFIKISKLKFGILLAVFIALLAVGSYGIFIKERKYLLPHRDTVANKQASSINSIKAPVTPVKKPRVVPADKPDSSQGITRKFTESDSASITPKQHAALKPAVKKRHKPKRKKFLGIF